MTEKHKNNILIVNFGSHRNYPTKIEDYPDLLQALQDLWKHCSNNPALITNFLYGIKLSQSLGITENSYDNELNDEIDFLINIATELCNNSIFRLSTILLSTMSVAKDIIDIVKEKWKENNVTLPNNSEE